MTERVPLLLPVSKIREVFREQPELQRQYGITGAEDDATLEARWQELNLAVRREGDELLLGFSMPAA